MNIFFLLLDLLLHSMIVSTMKLLFTSLLLIQATAFVVTKQQHKVVTPLFLSLEERVKSAGAGIAIVPAGGNSVFDPGQEGKLGGTNDLSLRLQRGVGYQAVTPTIDSADSATVEAQHWLEDIGVPTNFAKPTAPVEATVLGRMSLITDDAPGDIQHVLLKLPEGFHYVEGQSLSVIPPGLTDQIGRASCRERV